MYEEIKNGIEEIYEYNVNGVLGEPFTLSLSPTM